MGKPLVGRSLVNRCIPEPDEVRWPPSEELKAGQNTREAMTMMHNPPHPGEILREDYLEPLDLTVTETAKALGVSRKTLSSLLNERAGVSPSMALRLARALDTTPELWINLQAQYDLWQAREVDLGTVERLVPA